MQIPSNTEHVLESMQKRGFSPEPIQEVRDSLARGEEKLSVFDFLVLDGRINIIEAELNTGKHDLFLNGFKATQIPGFRNYTDQGLNTGALVNQLLHPPSGFGQSGSEQTKVYLESISDQMQTLRELDHKLYHNLGGVLRPMLLHIDAGTNKRFLNADSHLHNRSWFPHYDHVTIQNAAYLLMGRSVKVTTLPNANIPQERLDRKANDPQNPVKQRTEEPFYWREIDFANNLHASKAALGQEMHPRFELRRFDSRYGYDPAKKLMDFKFPDLQNPGELEKAVHILEQGKIYTARTEVAEYPTILMAAHASKRTFAMRSDDQNQRTLSHDMFRTAEAQQQHLLRYNKYNARNAPQGQEPVQQYQDGALNQPPTDLHLSGPGTVAGKDAAQGEGIKQDTVTPPISATPDKGEMIPPSPSAPTAISDIPPPPDDVTTAVQYKTDGIKDVPPAQLQESHSAPVVTPATKHKPVVTHKEGKGPKISRSHHSNRTVNPDSSDQPKLKR